MTVNYFNEDTSLMYERKKTTYVETFVYSSSQPEMGSGLYKADNSQNIDEETGV